MKFSSLGKIEKVCIIGICITFLIFVVCGIWLLQNSRKDVSDQIGVTLDTEESSEALADEMIYYPDNIQLGEPMPEFIFYGIDGEEKKLSDYRGKNIIILYWTSWCKYCKEEFKNMQDYADLLKSYKDVEFILLNKLDEKKETKEQALKFLAKNDITFSNYFDENLTIYNNSGIKIVPTMLGIDSKGVLKICKPGNIGGVDNLAALIDYVKFGGAYQTEQFIKDKLTSEEGGVYVNYVDSDNASPSGKDVLSESQGIMMEYATLKQDKELFDRYSNYVNEKMMISGSLTSWMVTEEDSAKVNALLDDLRIYRALNKANQLWGGYDELLIRWEKNIYKYNTKNNQLVDFYDFTGKEKAKRITLCFIDLEALLLLRESEPNYSEVYNNAYSMLKAGFISADFPLYYSWYDYERNQYVADDLNMAEAMYTLLNLAEAGELKEETVTWLEQSMEAGGIKARYSTDGKIVDDYDYESTAIYAIVAMIGKETDNARLMTKAIARMELMRVNEKNLLWNGAFTAQEGKDIFSFDQCMPLLAYGYIEY